MAFGKKFWNTLRDAGAVALAPVTGGLSLGLLAGGKKNRKIAKQIGKEGFWGLLGEQILGETSGSLDDAPPQFDVLDKLISLRDRYAAASTGAGGYSEFFTGAGTKAGRGPISGPKPKSVPTVIPPSVGEPTGGSRPGRSRNRRFKASTFGIPPQGVL